MDSKSKKELIAQCKQLGIQKYSTKTKPELIQLITSKLQETLPQPITRIDTIPSTITHTNSILFIDLFCGIGGFHQALHRIGGRCVFACDIDEQCRTTYETNYGLKPAGDISKIDIHTIPNFDILCGGFPCQSFSNSGNKKGLDDKRGQLFEYILQIANLRKPSFLFLENVKHIQTIDNGKAFQHILSRIKETGYDVDTIELSPHQLGIPQQRDRIIFICVRRDLYKGNVSATFTIPNIPICIDTIFERNVLVTEKYKISRHDEDILNAWDEMIQTFEVNENLSPTILCNEFYTTYSDDEFKQLPDWKQNYITKNRPIYNKYKSQWDIWYTKYKNILTKKEIYGKLEWQTGKKKKEIVYLIILYSYANLVFVLKKQTISQL